MQGIKDAFYGMLRDRVAAANAGRTTVVRGVVRPGVLVIENELPGAAVEGVAPAEVFCLRWDAVSVDATGLVRLGCAIRYVTDGSQAAAGMDRGRALAAMDAELQAALAMVPGAVMKADGSQVFWGECQFGAAVMASERMERTAMVEVYGYGS